jgi:hypothetical protein
MIAQTYTVVATIQSRDNDPVEVRYATRTNEIGAATCVASLLNQFSTEDEESPFKVRLLSIRVDASASV